MEDTIKSSKVKVSKGYRLKPSTHDLIDRLQELLAAGRDAVIEKACMKLYRETIRKKQKNSYGLRNLITLIK